jgi:hypothetical protein
MKKTKAELEYEKKAELAKIDAEFSKLITHFEKTEGEQKAERIKQPEAFSQPEYEAFPILRENYRFQERKFQKLKDEIILKYDKQIEELDHTNEPEEAKKKTAWHKDPEILIKLLNSFLNVRENFKLEFKKDKKIRKTPLFEYACKNNIDNIYEWYKSPTGWVDMFNYCELNPVLYNKIDIDNLKKKLKV